MKKYPGTLVEDVTYAEMFPVYGKILVAATGNVKTSGWSNVRLSPFTGREPVGIFPPPDGMWDFYLVGDAPSGPVLQAILPVAANKLCNIPNWFKGVRVHAAGGKIELSGFGKSSEISVPPQKNLIDKGNILFREQIAVFEDSQQPIGFCGGFSIRMKKLVHRLLLTIEGPDEAHIRNCLQGAVFAGLVAEIILVYCTGGAALWVAIDAFLSYLFTCLGHGYAARIDDESYWEEWCT